MAYWKCPACGFEAQHDKQRQEHANKTASDPIHAKIMRPQESAPGGGRDSWKKPGEPAKTPNQAPRQDPKWGGKGPQKP